MDGKAAAAPPRHVLHVDRQRCLGCGQCLGSCPKGLLAVREHSACLVDPTRCDGRGTCLGHCSADALSLRLRALAG